ncbi:hypothetical protein H0R92_10180 [Treponema sp. OMZ 840]|uniref:glycosyltransferase family 2 protein n=1 Tax=Treponema sp. OMZ 840 TaxID=244313 RepID=UPI003D91E98C
MNTIPLIFNERQIQRTVLGGSVTPLSDFSSSIAAILLNRSGNHYCARNIENLFTCGFSEIIVVESSSKSYSLEDLSQRYPPVKFIVPLEELTAGDMINIGISEIKSPYALVLWDDIKIAPPILSESLVRNIFGAERLCTVPFLQSSNLRSLPVKMDPVIEKNTFFARPASVAGAKKTVYPFDFIGIYNKQKFMQLGGYDYTIVSPYWQNLDFALRGWLWGEVFEFFSSFRILYDGDPPAEDMTADCTQLRFFLKNCAPVFKSDCAYIPKLRYFDFLRRCPGGPFKAYALFADACSWTYKNRFRFKTDIVRFTQNWKAESANESAHIHGRIHT